MPNAEDALSKILELVEQSPTAYLAPTEQKYSALVGFIIGFSQGTRYASGDLSKVVFPEGFSQFVRAELNSKHGFEKFKDSDHFFDIIRSEAQDEKGAFNLFFELWSRFRNQLEHANDLKPLE